jgi:hypothetical protein
MRPFLSFFPYLSAFLLSWLLVGQLPAQPLQIGIEAGWLSSLNDDYSFPGWQHRRHAWYGGLQLRYAFREKTALFTGLQSLPQGYRDLTCFLDEQGHPLPLNGKRNYVSIPLGIEIELGKQRQWLIQSGSFLALNWQARQDHPPGIGGCEVYYLQDLRGSTYDLYIGGLLGLGHQWQVPTLGKLRLWIKALGSLTPIDPFRRNHSFLLSIEWLIPRAVKAEN